MSIPLIIAVAAGAYIVTSGKKRSRSKPKIIDKGSYSYSSDCNRLWIEGFDVAKIDMVEPNAQQKAAIYQFAEEVMDPAAAAALEARYGSGGFDDRPPMWITELGLDTIARVLPGCEFVEGKAARSAALALLPMAIVRIVINIQGSTEELMAAAAVESRIIAREIARRGGVKDIVKLIRLVRENPGQYSPE